MSWASSSFAVTVWGCCVYIKRQTFAEGRTTRKRPTTRAHRSAVLNVTNYSLL